MTEGDLPTRRRFKRIDTLGVGGHPINRSGAKRPVT